MTRVALPLPPREELERRYSELRDSYEKMLFELQRRARLALSAHSLNATIKYRVKSFKSWYQKVINLARNSPDRESVEVTDVLAMRIVSPFLDDVSGALAALRQEFEVRDLDRKGAEFSVREFGYESVHCLLRVPQDLYESFHIAGPFDCEVQLRTILQDAWAEVEHEIIYKNQYSPLDSALQRKLAALNASLSLSDITFQEIRDYQRDLKSELTARRADFWSRLHDDLGERSPTDSQDASEPLEIELADEIVGNLDAELLSALRAHNAGEFLRAEQLYTRIIDTDPGPEVAAVVLMHRGMAKFARSFHRDALADFGQAIELNNSNVRAYFYRGTVYRVLGDVSAALADFTTCIDQDPYNVDCLHQRSATLLETGDMDGALRDCRAGLALEPDSSALQQLAATIEERAQYGKEHER